MSKTHATERLCERYGLAAGKVRMRAIADYLASLSPSATPEDAGLLTIQRSGREVWLLNLARFGLGELWVKVVFDRTRKSIVTFLPRG